MLIVGYDSFEVRIDVRPADLARYPRAVLERIVTDMTLAADIDDGATWFDALDAIPPGWASMPRSQAVHAGRSHGGREHPALDTMVTVQAPSSQFAVALHAELEPPRSAAPETGRGIS